jgi:magnesium transporter
VVLAAFLPVMSSQCGNLGSQALAVTTRGMTLGELRALPRWRVIGKEAWLGLMNGMVCGAISGVALYFASRSQSAAPSLSLALSIFLAMAIGCMLAGVAGAAIPMLLRRFGLDPATASAIFLSTIADIASMGLFLGLAAWLIPG